MKTTHRYKETGYNYAAYYTVTCPHCGNSAEVSNPKCRKTESVTIHCQHCSFQKSLTDFKFYKSEININCPNCGKPIQYERENVKEKPEKIIISCPTCHTKMEIKPRVKSYYPMESKQGMKLDPYFGFPLWFQAEIKGHLFWAYNREHLIEIQAYVGSQLRERQYVYGMTMVERLPQFIKDAKNRARILAIINTLLQK